MRQHLAYNSTLVDDAGVITVVSPSVLMSLHCPGTIHCEQPSEREPALHPQSALGPFSLRINWKNMHVKWTDTPALLVLIENLCARWMDGWRERPHKGETHTDSIAEWREQLAKYTHTPLAQICVDARPSFLFGILRLNHSDVLS